MDPIANMFSQIKNAQAAQKERLVIPYAKIKLAILEILKNHRQIADFCVVEKKHFHKKENSKAKKSDLIINEIEIDLLQDNFSDIRRISRPGRRVYASFTRIPRPKRAQALVIVSTSKGVFEGEEARKKGLGGEIIAEVR